MDSKNVTKPRQFRFSQETLDQIDRLAALYHGVSRADVLRLAVARLAATDLGEPEKKPKKSSKGG
jgi:hypothetical protein